MDTEATIAATLRQSITPPPDTVLTPEPVVDITYGQAASDPIDFKLDEITQYKLQDYFGEQYKDSDEVKRQQTEYIYSEISQIIDNADYGFVLAKIRDLERIIGLTNADNRLYRLYQWLKLDKTRRSVEAELGAITNGY